jgi:flagellar protein FlaJ
MLGYRGLATLIFGGFIDKYANFFLPVKESLPKADIRIPFRTYMSIVFLSTTISYVASIVALVILLNTVFHVTLVMQIMYYMFIPLLVSLVCFVTISFYPNQRMVSRRKNIEMNLPFVLTHMGAVAESGIPPYIIFKLIAQFEEYGDISKEMKRIVRNVDTFGIDPLTAVKQAATRSPSDSFRQILLGYVTTTESGGDVKTFLRNAGQQSLFEWRIKREKFLQQLSAYAEFYTGLLIAAPLFMVSLFAVMNMIQPTMAGYSILDLMKMSIYLVIPVMNGGFLLFLRGVEVEM